MIHQKDRHRYDSASTDKCVRAYNSSEKSGNRQSKIYVTTGACLEEKRSVLQQCTDSDLGQKSRHPQ